MENTSDRFKGLPWFPKKGEEVLIGGAGGIGSWLALWLTRAGFNVTVCDFDTVEAHNIGGQLFGEEDIGRLKVEALQKNIYNLTGKWINCISEKFTINSENNCSYMFSAFDNMSARKVFFEAWKKTFEYDNKNAIFVDGRLLAEQLEVFCVTPDRVLRYEETLFDDTNMEAPACTAKQTSHIAGLIASLMTAYFTNFVSNVYLGENERIVPFYNSMFTPLANSVLKI